MYIQRARGLTRVTGLLFKKSVSYALLIPHCRQVHTFGMRFPLTVVFVDAAGIIVRVIPLLKPWRMSSYVKNAAHVIEFPPDMLPQGTSLNPGATFPHLSAELLHEL